MESFAEHYESLFETIHRHMPDVDTRLIRQAVHYAEEKHQNQKRKDGSP